MLQIGDPELESIAIMGRFGTGDLGALLRLLNTTSGIVPTGSTTRRIRLESEPGR